MPSNNNVTATMSLRGQHQVTSGLQQVDSRVGRLGSHFRAAGGAGIHMGHGLLSARAGVMGLGAGLVGLAGGAAVGTLAGFVSDARESAKVAADTAATLKSTGGAANVTAAQVGNLATAISNKTGIDDEAIQSGQNMLLTFTNIRNEAGKGNDIFSQASSTLADLASKMGTDPPKAAIQLGKALNDPVKGITALTKVGVTFDASQRKQITSMVKHGNTAAAQKVILHELNKEFGGQAAAQHDGWDRLTVSMGNLREQIGGYLLPVVNKLGDWFAGPGFARISGALDHLFGGISRGGGRVQPVLRTFGRVWRWIEPTIRSVAREVRTQLALGIATFQRRLAVNMPMLRLFGKALLAAGKVAIPWLIRTMGHLQSHELRYLIVGLGYGLDAVRILATGFLQFGRGAISALGWVLHAAATAFGWVPGLGGKLKRADKAFTDFRVAANAELSKIEHDINVNVDTAAADAKLRNWHPSIGAPYFAAPTVRPGVSVAQSQAQARTGGILASVTDVTLNGRAVGTAVTRQQSKQAGWR